MNHAAGSAMWAVGSAAPASSNSTRLPGSSDSRADSTQPAVPPPTTMKSKVVTAVPFLDRCSPVIGGSLGRDLTESLVQPVADRRGQRLERRLPVVGDV